MPCSMVKSGLTWSRVFRRRHLGRRVTAVTHLRWPTVRLETRIRACRQLTEWYPDPLLSAGVHVHVSVRWNHRQRTAMGESTQHWVSTGPCLIYDTDRYGWLDWWSTLRMRARQAPLTPTTADCHLNYFPACMPPRPTVYRWHCGSEMGWHQPDGCQHRVDTSPILTHYAMFIRNIQQWYDKYDNVIISSQRYQAISM